MGDKIKEALQILIDLGVPKGQQNERTALCLLALTDVKKNSQWRDAQNPLIGITPMMEFAKAVYQKGYAPNTRETFRRFSMHQLVEAGIALYNPDRTDRPINSPQTVYQLTPLVLHIVKLFGTDKYSTAVGVYHNKIGIIIDEHGKMPDCIFYFEPKGWLVLVEAVTSHGPIDSKRKIELQKLFDTELVTVYVTAFPDRQTFTKFTTEIAWETEVWLADNPSHLIHFDGEKFLG